MQYLFGEFQLDRQTGQLHGAAGPVVLRRQAWKLLVELLDQAPSLIGRDQLLDRVWGRQALSANVLPQTISELRQALGDDARNPRYIETCHGRGYRMACEVERLVPTSESSSTQIPIQNALRQRSSRFGRAVPVGLTGLGLALALWLLWPNDDHRVAPGPEAAHNERTEALRRQAEVALARHDPASAAAHLRALTLLEPANRELALLLAMAELDALQGEQARNTLSLLGADPALRQHPPLLLLQARLAEIDGDLAQAERLAEAARLQAHSLDEAEDYLDAVRMQALAIQRQGELERAARGLEAAITDPALSLTDSQRFELILDLAIVRREQGQVGLAREGLAQAEQLADGQLERDRLTIEQALLQAADGQPQAAWEQLERLAARLDADVPPSVRLAAFNALGSVGMEIGQTEQALAAFERGVVLARSSGQAYRMAGLQINMGSLLARRDRFEEAERLWQQALETFEQIGDRRGRATALGNLAAAASAQGQNARAQSLNQQALEEFRDLGLDGPRARTAFNLALIASREGRLDQAESLLAEAQSAYQRVNHSELVLHVGAVRVDHRILAGDLLLAEALLSDLDLWVEQASPLRQAAVLASRGRLAQWRGDLVAARSSLEQAQRLRIESGQAGWIATSELELMQLALLEGGDPWRLRVDALALADRFDAMNQTRAAASTRLLAAEALLSQGETIAAREELAEIRAELLRFDDRSLALDLAWAEAWAARDEERAVRLENLARSALEQGYMGKLARIEASLAAHGLSLPATVNAQHGLAGEEHLVALLPGYVRRPEPIIPPSSN
ncbi:MAG: winged helix-turn-helix domain-containing protein [Wenzhouxiangella sp.]